MKTLISGASGLVGTALASYLEKQGDQVIRLVRRNAHGGGEISWYPDNQTVDPAHLEGHDVVYHLAGENIAEGRWTDAKKARIRDSRVVGTTFLSETLAKLDRKPSVIVSASAIGFYGDRGDEILREQSSPGDGYLAEVSQQWEEATKSAEEAGIRVVNVRIGIVLSKDGGALGKMLTPFRMGVGGNLGSGKQYMSWITLPDLVGALHHCASNNSVSGPVNGVAPNPVTNAAFTKAMGHVLSRPTLFPVPAFAARVAFGEMADALLLSSTRVESRRLFESGYTFQHSNIEQALQAVLSE
jgi:uncharacterized protein (TIGR01777 family)